MQLKYSPIQVGDVIYIEANSGASKRIGRSDAFATEFDLEAEEYVPLPKGDVHKRKEVIQVGKKLAVQHNNTEKDELINNQNMFIV